MISTKGKILVISSGLKMGGVERSSVNISNYFAKKGYEVTFVALFPVEKFFILDNRIQFVEPFFFNKGSIKIIRTIVGIRNLIKICKPDTILSYTKLYSALTCLSSYKINSRIVISERASIYYKWSWLIRVFSKIAFKIRPPDAIIAQTNEAAKYYKKKFRDKICVHVINNSVRKMARYPDIAREEFILAIGRLDDYGKGFDRLIHAFSIIENREWKLYFAGQEGPQMKLRHLVNSLGLMNRVVFLGKVKNIDILMARAGIFVIPSRLEGFPNALCEAMAAGIPCISFNFSAGPSELIKNNINGILIENDNIIEMAKSIDLLIENTELRRKIGLGATEIQSILNEEVIGEKYLKILFNEYAN